MNDIIKNKHVLGGLTLRDLKEKIDSLHVWSVEIDGELYERFGFYNDKIEIWKSDEQYMQDFPADQGYDLDSPVKVRDGKVILLHCISDVEVTMTFGKMMFVPTDIDIDILERTTSIWTPT